MGTSNYVSHSTFPSQGQFLGHEVYVTFHYDLTKIIRGVIVRDDNEAPGLMIIRLEDGRYVMSTECQYQIMPTKANVGPSKPVRLEIKRLLVPSDRWHWQVVFNSGHIYKISESFESDVMCMCDAVAAGLKAFYEAENA